MRTHDFGFLAGLAALIAVTRWPLAPEHLFYFDSVNMAYALEDFDPRLHQPQPPGYPLYVALCRLIHLLGFTPEHSFLLSGVVAGALAGWLLWRFGRELGNPRAGWIAALLFLFTPVFLFNSVTNQSRGFSAVASAGAAWLCWRAAQPGTHVGWIAVASCFLGTLAGFRPVESVMLSPLLLWVIWVRRPGLRAVATAVCAGALPMLAWGYVLVTESGGLLAYVELMRGYSNQEGIFAATGGPGAWRVFIKTLEYVGAMHLVTLLPWVWALVFVRPQLKGMGWFLVVWVLPGLLFQVLGHAADPCHSLATITALCWVGGLTLARLQPRHALVATTFSCLLGTALFLHPMRGAARATSHSVVRVVNRSVVQALATLRAMESSSKGEPLTLVVRDTLVTWRHLRYYFPTATVWVDTGTERWSPSHATEFPQERHPHLVVLDRNGIHVHPNQPLLP